MSIRGPEALASLDEAMRDIRREEEDISKRLARSAEKIGKIATVLEVTTEFLLTESATTPDEEVLDEAFFRKYKNMSEPDKKKIRKILDAWEDE